MCRAQPTQLVTITQVGDEWQTVRARIARIAYRTRQAGQPLAWAWTVERNPRGTGHHVHGVRRGPWMDHAVLAAACHREGTGFPWLTPADTNHDPGTYIFKYMSKGVRLHSLDDVLALNGRRLVHTTRGFWLSDLGVPCAFREARRGDGTWEVVFAGERATGARDARAAADLRRYVRTIAPTLQARREDESLVDDAVQTVGSVFQGADELPVLTAATSLAVRARKGDAWAGWRQAERIRKFGARRSGATSGRGRDWRW